MDCRMRLEYRVVLHSMEYTMARTPATDTVGPPIFDIAYNLLNEEIERPLLAPPAGQQELRLPANDPEAMEAMGIVGGCNAPHGDELIELVRVYDPNVTDAYVL